MEVKIAPVESVDSRSDRLVDEATVGIETDAHLVLRAAQGDAQAFEDLLAPRLDRLFRIAVAILRSEPDAHDVLQDASLRAWRALPTLRDAGRFDAWITQIVVNGCRSTLQRRRRQVNVVALDALAAEPPDGSGQPSTRMPDLAEAEVVRQAFERLDPATRALLVLHYVEGLTLGELNPILRSPVGTLKWRLWRARRKLASALEAEQR